MRNTKIEWCNATWNPVTGCLHNCEYCYAKDIVHRFKGKQVLNENGQPLIFTADCKPTKWYDFSEPFYKRTKKGKLMKSVYSFGFAPTFHRYWLDKPQQWKKPLTIFVGDMCDLFGEWAPDKWIEEVFKACADAPQHRYLFLTKSPERYRQLSATGKLPLDFWYGTTVTNSKMPMWFSVKNHTFLSIEPLLEPFISNNIGNGNIDWAIIGAETGDRKDKVVPKREWIEDIVNKCREYKIPVFMKNSLAVIWDAPLIQEFPWQI